MARKKMNCKFAVVVLTLIALAFEIFGNIWSYIFGLWFYGSSAFTLRDAMDVFTILVHIVCMVLFAVYAMSLYEKSQSPATLPIILSVYSLGMLTAVVGLGIATAGKGTFVVTVLVAAVFAAGYIVSAISAFRGIPDKIVYAVSLGVVGALTLGLSSVFEHFGYAVAVAFRGNIIVLFFELTEFFKQSAPIIFLAALLVFGLANRSSQIVKSTNKKTGNQ